MNKEERHQRILEQLEVKEKVWVSDLAAINHVTPETIRRDLAELEMNDQLTRVHGGAVRYRPLHKEPLFKKKMSLHAEEKKIIAKYAAELIEDGDTIAIDVGSTTAHLADMLENVQGLTIVTNSLYSAERFNLAIEEQRITGQVIMLPGVTNPYQSSVRGIYTVEFLKRFNFNRAFISCGGLTRDAIYDFDMDESLVSEAMISCSQESILLTDSSKLNKKSLFEIGPISNISTIICDKEKPEDWYENSYEWITIPLLLNRKEENVESRLPHTS
ncbi:DeoR/GlpR transcriptional regulator [Oceanobacillus piezotolerans]|uniref:DeoR/GlpR transcriptional regulator n=1 Tax=Oceanobacillus piezotolerans TaxID=2448030 RepID=A0A498DAF8_9BACI|nr:DeoR/GlpR family DNA-binding transcription regulator [Oceanobacillus piezotolerans]RLL46724.1 DeoR/GlpR transcriptional regulator [Oceanobacillus piezotolerans]